MHPRQKSLLILTFHCECLPASMPALPHVTALLALNPPPHQRLLSCCLLCSIPMLWHQSQILSVRLILYLQSSSLKFSLLSWPGQLTLLPPQCSPAVSYSAPKCLGWKLLCVS